MRYLVQFHVTWAGGTEPTFTPLVKPEAFGLAIEKAMKAPAIGRPWS